MSASRSATLAPSACKAKAILTAVVDFPTPPLPEAIAMIFLTPGSGLTPDWVECGFTFDLIDTLE